MRIAGKIAGMIRPPLLRESGAAPSLLDLIDLERIEPDIFRTTLHFKERWSLYGGQVAAQALRAAGLTVEPERLAHSLHGYFLRPGDASRPVVFKVFRDRDGGSFSARRVVALQGRDVIFNMAASFHDHGPSPADATETTPPSAGRPEGAEPYVIPRLASFEGRMTDQPQPGLEFPSRFWARCTDDLPDDPLVHAAALTYLSDITTGLVRFHDQEHASSSSLDHAVWFHRGVDAGGWTLIDCHPHTVARDRGFYTGSLWDQQGSLVASFAQEALFRARKPTLRADG